MHSSQTSAMANNASKTPTQNRGGMCRSEPRSTTVSTTAFTEDELPIIALLHLFQGVVDINVLRIMGDENCVPAVAELNGRSEQELNQLLSRAVEIGLLTHLGGTWFGVHPALPWFLRQLFIRFYSDGDLQIQANHNGGSDLQRLRNPKESILFAWVSAFGVLGDKYWWEINRGNRNVIQNLCLENNNFLEARSQVLKHRWLEFGSGIMQGLDALYNSQERGAEWARLVDEITPLYCCGINLDEPKQGWEREFGIVMGYRVKLAMFKSQDYNLAGVLQAKMVAWWRDRAGNIVDLPSATSLDEEARNRARNLGVSIMTYAQILAEQRNSDCVGMYEESFRCFQLVKDKSGMASACFNLGHALKDLYAVRDLDAAESAYRQSYELSSKEDKLAKSMFFHQIGMIYYDRILEEDKKDTSSSSLIQGYVETAQSHFLNSLKTSPPDAYFHLGAVHSELGKLYSGLNRFDLTRSHFENAIQYLDDSGNKYQAGGVRANMAAMFFSSVNSGDSEISLRRALAYAEAALNDFQQFKRSRCRG